jgi:segregation and condensation protein B
MPKTSLTDTLEAILFAASEPLSAVKLAVAAETDAETVEHALAELRKRLTGGIRLAHAGGTYRLVTAPETADAVRSFLEDSSRQDLTRPALETLAIIAYRGPITKSGVEQIRGVASETMLRSLIARGLVSEAGRSPEPGRPQMYAVSHTFLQHFGLTSTRELPPLPEETA